MNLISLEVLDDESYQIEIRKRFINIMKNHNLIVNAPNVTGIYVINFECVSPNSTVSLVTQSRIGELVTLVRVD